MSEETQGWIALGIITALSAIGGAMIGYVCGCGKSYDLAYEAGRIVGKTEEVIEESKRRMGFVDETLNEEK